MATNHLNENDQPVAGFNFTNNEIKATNTLYGILIGMTADGEINDLEINALNIWLLDNEIYTNAFPLNVVKARVEGILTDGVITEEERENLFATVTEMLGGNYQKTGMMGGTSSTFGAIEPDMLIFKEATFCLTGAFVTGTRDKCEQLISEKGGVAVKSITKGLNYLIIGTFASRDWIGTSHGRKIEKAIHYQNKGHPLVILTEETWSKHL